MDGSQANEDAVVEAIYALAADEMRKGASDSKVTATLIKEGLAPELAAVVVDKLSIMRSQAIRSAARKSMLYGGLWCVGGLLVTILTYGAASGGGRFIVAWGAIVYGGIQFFRGLNRLMRT